MSTATPSICIPAAGITRDQLGVKIDKKTGRALLYPRDKFRLVVEVNLIAPIYWALEMVGRIAEARHHSGLGRWKPEEGIQGSVIFIGSISSQGIPGQIAARLYQGGPRRHRGDADQRRPHQWSSSFILHI